MGAFDGKVVLVTGATSGIGKAVAVAFGREGARVVVAGRREREGVTVAEEIHKAGGTAIFARADVQREEDIAAMVQAAVRAYGRLDVAVNNAGTEGRVGLLGDLKASDFDEVVSTNLRGTWLSLKYEIPALLKSGGGAIVNMSSIMGSVGAPGLTLYSATKGGIEGMTRSAAMEYAQAGVRVNAVAPGTIYTEMLERMLGAAGQDPERYITAKVPMGKGGTPEQVADAVLWLASDKSSFVTGQVITIDGGYTVR